MSGIQDRHWEKTIGHINENDIDVRYVLKQPNDHRAHGSLRIVSHPDLPAGHVRAYVSFVTARRPKTPEEKQELIEQYQMDEKEQEVYSVDEHITTQDIVHTDRLAIIQSMFNVNIFED